MSRAGALVGMLAPLVGAAAAGGGKRRREGRGGAQPARTLFRLRPLQGRRDGRREAGTNFSAHLRCCAAQGTRSSCPRSLLHGSRAAGNAGAGRPRSAASPSRLIARQTGPAFARALPALPLPQRVRGWAVCPVLTLSLPASRACLLTSRPPPSSPHQAHSHRPCCAGTSSSRSHLRGSCLTSA